MLLRRLAERIRSGSWGILALELVFVVVGILLAFQLDRAYQASQDRELERRYLERLRTDLGRDIAAIDEVIERTHTRVGQVRLLEEAIADPGASAADPEGFAMALEKVTWRSVPRITTGTYDELRSTGRMVLLESEELRGGLVEYYGSIPDQRRLGLGEDDQDRFRVLTVGLLSADHLSFIEDSASAPFDLSPEEARRIALELVSREEAHPWLSRLVKYQVLMRRLAGDFGLGAAALVEEIDVQLGDGD